MGYSYNHGLVTAMKGAAIQAARITGLNSSPCTVAEQANAGFISSATISSGVVTLQLEAPYPPGLVIALAQVSSDDATTDIITARVDAGGYDATAGTLIINLSDDDDSGAPIAASPSSTDELHVLMVFKRYTNI